MFAIPTLLAGLVIAAAATGAAAADLEAELRESRLVVEALREKVATLSGQLMKEHSSTDGDAKVPFGVFPMLRHMGCTHNNLEVPHLISASPGEGRLIVDVGLSYDGQEMMAAVSRGFNVIGFEMLPDNLAELKARYKGAPNVIFLSPEWVDGSWRWPASVSAPPPIGANGKGTAFILEAGLDEAAGVTTIKAGQGKSYGSKLGNVTVGTPGSSGQIPARRRRLLRASHGKLKRTGYDAQVKAAKLDDVLPIWAKRVFLLKIDTQGWEYRVLAGARNVLSQGIFSYVQFEFSPWLMKRASAGSPLALASLLPDLGGVCFDMMGRSHSAIRRPSVPLSAYVEHLDSGRHSKAKPELAKLSGDPMRHMKDPFGPWDDITCFFPNAMNF